MDSKFEFLVPLLMKKLYEEENGELSIQKTFHFIRVNSPKKILNADGDIEKWLELNSKYFKIKLGMVIGITSVSLCGKHCSDPGTCLGNCDKLHICRFFILSEDFKCINQCKYWHDIKHPHNYKILRRNNLHFLDIEKLRRLFRKAENRSQQIIPPICRDFNSKQCEKKNCRFLHICRRFLISRCPEGKKCKLSHLIDDKFLAILRDYCIYFSNIHDGLHKLREMYSALERSFERGLSKKAESSYDLFTDSADFKSKVTLTERKFHSSLMDLSIGKHQRKNRKNNSLNKTNLNLTTSLCMQFLSSKQCSNEDCRFHHKPLPYQWQYKISYSSEVDWFDFDPSKNDELEEKYCHLLNEFHAPGEYGFIKYSFENMTFSNLKSEGILRRLSSPSSVRHGSTNWTTTWAWYLKTDSDDWVEYKKDPNNPESLSSVDIEERYLSNREGKLHYISDRAVAFIDFKEMFQMNGKKRAVLRRPKYFKETQRTKQDRIQSDSSGLLPMPVDVSRNWKPPNSKPKRRPNQRKSREKKVSLQTNKQTEEHDDDDDDDLMPDFKITNLNKNDPQFRNISEKFNETMEEKGAKILSIEVIKNKELWEEYERCKRKMAKKLDNFNANEKDLFHGTHLTNVSAILKRGFDVRLSEGAVNIRFGKGSYFTKKADYAHKYIISEDGICKMLLVKVLVGLSCRGNMTYVRPPLIDPNNKEGELYDSCVDDEEIPNVFVIFANNQMYPAYLITYEMPLT